MWRHLVANRNFRMRSWLAWTLTPLHLWSSRTPKSMRRPLHLGLHNGSAVAVAVVVAAVDVLAVGGATA